MLATKIVCIAVINCSIPIYLYRLDRALGKNLSTGDGGQPERVRASVRLNGGHLRNGFASQMRIIPICDRTCGRDIQSCKIETMT